MSVYIAAFAAGALSAWLGFRAGRRFGLRRASWIVMCRDASTSAEVRFGLCAEIERGETPRWIDGHPRGGQWTEGDRSAWSWLNRAHARGGDIGE